MDSGPPIWISQGRFGRTLVNLTARALVEHAHGELNVLIKLGGADATFESQGRALPLDDGSLLIFNPWVPHAKRANGGAPTLILSLLIDARWFAETFDVPHAILARPFPCACEAASEEVLLRARRLAGRLSANMALGAHSVEEAVADLVGALVRRYAGPRLAAGVIAFGQPSDYRIRNALAFIHEHASENPRIGDIARHAGLSHSRFYEQFRNCIGVSPQCYIDWVRMTIATRWLSRSERPLIELSNELGFNAQSHFTRFFTQRTGIPPGQFRRQVVGFAAAAPEAPAPPARYAFGRR